MDNKLASYNNSFFNSLKYLFLMPGPDRWKFLRQRSFLSELESTPAINLTSLLYGDFSKTLDFDYLSKLFSL